MINQITIMIGTTSYLVMLFPEHLSMVEITHIHMGEHRVAFDPCQMVHIVPDKIEEFTDLNNRKTLGRLKLMLHHFFSNGEN